MTAEETTDTAMPKNPAAEAAASESPKAKAAKKNVPKIKQMPQRVEAALTQIGEQMLKANPTMKAIYVAYDGICFFAREDAESYASKLRDKTVVTVERAANE